MAKNLTKRQRMQKNSNLIRNYGLTLKAYEDMMDAQEELCAVCKQPEAGVHNRGNTTVALSLSVDHDHETGAVRALLCHKCNKALGLFNDNIELLSDALAYLVSHK